MQSVVSLYYHDRAATAHLYALGFIESPSAIHNVRDRLIINCGSTNMDGVIKDLGKIQSTGTQVFKKLVYYGYIPLILYLGGRTIDWSALFPKA